MVDLNEVHTSLQRMKTIANFKTNANFNQVFIIGLIPFELSLLWPG